MISQIQIIRNIGQFSSAAPGAAVPFAKLNLVFAENGRGKTTLTSILRSLKSGDPNLILERRRLGAQNPPHVVIGMAQPDRHHQFIAGAWDAQRPDIQIFDDAFVKANVHQGQEVDSEQRKNLLELVLGEQGVQLSRTVADLSAEGTALGGRVKNLAGQFGPEVLNGLTVDEFCDLRPDGDLDVAEVGLRRRIAAAEQLAQVGAIPDLRAPAVPGELDAGPINEVLARVVPGLNDQLMAEVKAHFASLAEEGEGWIRRGMDHEKKTSEEGTSHNCPMCAQDLGGSRLFTALQRYFSPEYEALRAVVEQMRVSVMTAHSTASRLEFERAANLVQTTRARWLPYVNLPEIPFDSQAVPALWRNAEGLVTAELLLKAQSLLEPRTLPENAMEALAAFEGARQHAATFAQAVSAANAQIAAARAQAAHENLGQLRIGLSRISAMRARLVPTIALRCDEYRAAQESQRASEVNRKAARAALDTYTQAVFGQFQGAINAYLDRFAAGFRIREVRQDGVRGGTVCNYEIEILGHGVPVAGGATAVGQPTFATTLSAGDRNALALAFFMANLDHNTRLSQQIVVIDDPMSSLDDHRRNQTAFMIQALAGRAMQVIVLSHSPGFLVKVTERLPSAISTSVLKISKAGEESAIELWDMEALKQSEHDRRHALLASFGQAGGSDARTAAVEIRPHLEHYLRVARPGRFQRTMLLGQMAQACRDSLTQGRPVFPAVETQELADLNAYSSLFHHDTNPDASAVQINETELLGFIARTLAFTGR